MVTTLTKRMAESLSEYYSDLGIRVRYLHSDINTPERMEIIQDLRTGVFDVLVGINLLREGLDIPEVALMAILDADKEGFLRSARSLIQTCGRAARNIDGKVLMYADVITKSMQQAIDETNRRRLIQIAYNKQHNIIPTTIHKNIAPVFQFHSDAQNVSLKKVAETVAPYGDSDNLEKMIREMEKEMKQAAKALDYERAAILRDRIRHLREIMLAG